jgi:hypothetical protein
MTNPVDMEAAENQPAAVFDPDDYDWLKHLDKAIKDLKTKILSIDIDWRYYDGEHPKVWMTDKLREMFDSEIALNMAENWCETAVDAPIKRLEVTEWASATDQSVMVKAAENVWSENNMDLDQKDLWTASRCCGESFLFVWLDDDKEFGVDLSINDARNVWWPENAHRSDPERVVKVWMDETEDIWRATVYYRYVVVRLRGPKINHAKTMPQARFFVVDEDDPGGEHGFEQVPVFRFARKRRRDSLVSRIKSIQDKINKLSANLMVSAEFNAFNKTIIMTQQAIADDDLKFRPNRALVLDPGGDNEGTAPTSIWEGTATELRIYSDQIDGLIDKLFTKAVLPGHLKIASGKTLPSGAAYEADEGPFVEDIEDMQAIYGATLKDLFDMLGIEVEPQWRSPHVKSDSEESTTVKTFKDAGLPLRLAMKYYAGWGEDRLKELDESPLSPQETAALAAAQALATTGGQTDEGGQGEGAAPTAESGGRGQPTTGVA